MFTIDEGMLYNNEQKINYNIMKLLEKQNEFLESVLNGSKIEKGINTPEVLENVSEVPFSDLETATDTIDNLKRQDLIKLAKEKGIEGNATTKSNEELKEFLEGAI